LDWPVPGPAAGPLSCVAKKVGKEGDPASGGRRRTRPLRGLKQLRRKAPPAAALLGGSGGAFDGHRAFTEAPHVISDQKRS